VPAAVRSVEEPEIAAAETPAALATVVVESAGEAAGEFPVIVIGESEVLLESGTVFVAVVVVAVVAALFALAIIGAASTAVAFGDWLVPVPEDEVSATGVEPAAGALADVLPLEAVAGLLMSVVVVTAIVVVSGDASAMVGVALVPEASLGTADGEFGAASTEPLEFEVDGAGSDVPAGGEPPPGDGAAPDTTLASELVEVVGAATLGAAGDPATVDVAEAPLDDAADDAADDEPLPDGPGDTAALDPVADGEFGPAVMELLAPVAEELLVTGADDDVSLLDDEPPVDDDVSLLDDEPPDVNDVSLLDDEPVDDDVSLLDDEPPVEDDVSLLDDEPPVEDDVSLLDDEPVDGDCELSVGVVDDVSLLDAGVDDEPVGDADELVSGEDEAVSPLDDELLFVVDELSAVDEELLVAADELLVVADELSVVDDEDEPVSEGGVDDESFVVDVASLVAETMGEEDVEAGVLAVDELEP
jgi:hypothetical protein